VTGRRPAPHRGAILRALHPQGLLSTGGPTGPVARRRARHRRSWWVSPVPVPGRPRPGVTCRTWVHRRLPGRTFVSYHDI